MSNGRYAILAVLAAICVGAAGQPHKGQGRNRAGEPQLNTRSPEARDWPADAWPELSEAQKSAAAQSGRTLAAEILEQTGVLPAMPVQSERFLIYWSHDRQQMARLATRLEQIYERIENLLMVDKTEGLPADGFRSRGFAGRAIVLVFDDHDLFRKVEAEAFGQLVPRAAAGMFHPRDEHCFIVLHHAGPAHDEDAFNWNVAKLATLAYMHRYRSPKRPPPWVNEGFAEYIAAASSPGSQLARQRRRQALEFLRSDGQIAPILSAAYDGDYWPGPQGIGPAIGALVLELMIKDKPQRFAQWMNAMKAGREWKETLQAEFGATPAQITDGAVRYYRTND